MTLRILHVLDHSLPLQSGYSFRTIALLREQRAMGWETFQLTTPKHYAPSEAEEDVAGLHFFRTKVPSTRLRRAPILNNAMIVTDTARRIEEILPRINPDIIHAHSPCLNGLAALRAGRKHGIPVVYEMRASWEDAAVDHGNTKQGSLRYKLSRALETYTVKRADGLTTICNGLADDIVIRGVARERITVIPNAVNIEDFELIASPDEQLRQQLGVDSGPVFGFIGSLYGYEGVNLLIEALPEIIKVHPGARIVLAGGGPVEADLRALTAKLGLDKRVLFVGRVPHDQVRRYYSIIDVLVYPRKSTRLTELVTPLKPLEAMSLGRPFIASDVGGHRELIPEHLRPYVFKADDVRDLVRVMLQLVEKRPQWPAMIAAARKYVAEQCTWRVSASRYRAVYGALVPRIQIQSVQDASSI